MDEALAEEAAILTGIGILTAFSLLVLLMAVIWLVRLSTMRFMGTVEQAAAGKVAPAGSEMRQKARAAVVAVTALLDRPDAGERPGTGHD